MPNTYSDHLPFALRLCVHSFPKDVLFLRQQKDWPIKGITIQTVKTGTKESQADDLLEFHSVLDNFTADLEGLKHLDNRDLVNLLSTLGTAHPHRESDSDHLSEVLCINRWLLCEPHPPLLLLLPGFLTRSTAAIFLEKSEQKGNDERDLQLNEQ